MDENSVLLDVRASKMRNPQYSIIVYQYLLGQWRINLCESREGPSNESYPEGHGEIKQAGCTYSPSTAHMIVKQLMEADEPLALFRSWARPYNSEYPGDRIRLDNKPSPGIRGE